MKTVYPDENNVVLDEKVLKENHLEIDKVRSLSSQFSYTIVTIST